ELGGAIGIAVLGSVLGSTYSEEIKQSITMLPAEAQEAAANSLAAALMVAEQLGPLGSALVDGAKEAWMNGLSEAMLIAAGIVAIAAIVSAIWLPHEHREGEEDDVIEPVIEG